MEPEIKAVAEEIKGIVANVQAESKATKQETVDQKAKFEKMETKFSELHDKHVELEKQNEELKLLQNQFQNSDNEVKEKQEKLVAAEIKCFQEFLVKSTAGENFDNFIANSESGRELKTLRTDVQESGGYITSTQFGGIVESNLSELGTLAQDCQVLTLQPKSNSIEYPLDDAAIINPETITEGAGTSTTTTETFSHIDLKVHELMRKVQTTTNMLEDGIINVEQWLAKKVARGFAIKEEALILSGTGVNEAKGILTYTADASTAYGAYTLDQLQVTNSGHATLINDDTKLDDLIATLKPFYYRNAKMYMHSTTAFSLLKLKDSNGRPLIDPSYSKNPSINLTYRGFPISIQQSMPVIAASALSIAFGDLKEAYTVVRKSGFKIIKDIYTSDSNVIIKTTERFGGAIVNFEAVKLMKVEA